MSAEAVWVGWLALFLIYEITAAVMERGKPDRLTLSRNVWKWFDRPGEKAVLAVFMGVLTAHFVIGWPGGLAVILSGAPVALVIMWELVRRKPKAVALLLLAPLLMGAEKCSISWPQPTPSPEPTVEPSPEPTPVPTPEPPQPTPPPVTVCPKPLAEGAYAYLRNKPYGQGLDSTVWVYGDPLFCKAIHGDQWGELRQCHLEGWPTRVECEMQLLGGCPVWQFRNAAFPTPRPCTDQSFEGQHMSCDHFGNTVHRDDPKTPEFEGEPKACGLQRDEYGPMAGFFVVAHGKGEVRACRPDWGGCGQWVGVDK